VDLFLLVVLAKFLVVVVEAEAAVEVEMVEMGRVSSVGGLMVRSLRMVEVWTVGEVLSVAEGLTVLVVGHQMVGILAVEYQIVEDWMVGIFAVDYRMVVYRMAVYWMVDHWMAEGRMKPW
jgi:hypothetical protein